MKTEPTIQELREAAKNHPNTFLAGALYVVDLYASQPMSAEQVHGLAEKYASGYYEKDDYEYNSLTDLCIWEKLVRAFKAGAALSTAPTVKADGWVSVEERLPEIIEGKDYSENVIAWCNGQRMIMCRTWVDAEPESGIVWANCYGNIDGDGIWDEDYMPTHWQPLPPPPTVNINSVE